MAGACIEEEQPMTGERLAAEASWIDPVLEEYEGRLTRYASRLTGNLETAREVVQETFLRLCQQRPSDVQGHLAEWLYRVARNLAFDARRKQGHLDRLDRQDVDGCQCAGPSPDLMLEHRDSTSRMLEAVDSLSAQEQEVLRLKFQDGLKYREIAEITGRTTNYVGVLIHSAIKKLRTQLQVDVATARGE
jgi:RNA polymerase sigma factor (sigma-70 family)